MNGNVEKNDNNYKKNKNFLVFIVNTKGNASPFCSVFLILFLSFFFMRILKSVIDFRFHRNFNNFCVVIKMAIKNNYCALDFIVHWHSQECCVSVHFLVCTKSAAISYEPEYLLHVRLKFCFSVLKFFVLARWNDRTMLLCWREFEFQVKLFWDIW